jgi:5-methylcytosine-specific restriction endonuclease McrA
MTFDSARFSNYKSGDKWRHNQPWRKMYNCVTWRRLRTLVLARDPVCKICNRAAATVADHKRDHKGDPKLFYDMNNLQGLCAPCHDLKTGETSHPGTSEEDKSPFSTIVGDAALDAALAKYKNGS